MATPSDDPQPPPYPYSKLRSRVVKSAHDLFVTKGYRATTTKEICARAEVSEPTLFRLFGSKAALYEATVLEPFVRFVEGWKESWLDLPSAASARDMCEELVRGLFKLVREDRQIFAELIPARTDPGNDLHDSAVAVSAQLRKALRTVQDLGVRTTESSELAHVDGPVTVASMASMIFGMVLLEDWVYPAGSRPAGRDRLIREITETVYFGIACRPLEA